MEAAILQDYGRFKLLEYADSFRELADSFHMEEGEVGEEGLNLPEDERKILLWNRQIMEQRSIFARQLREVSEMMEGVAKEDYKIERYTEKELKQMIKQMRAEGIQLKDVYYYVLESGHKIMGVQMRNVRESVCSVEEAAGYFSVLLDMPLIPHKNAPFYVSAEYNTYYFVEEPVYHIMTGVAKATKQSEKVSGDLCELFEYGDGKSALFLSDGMGSGEDAFRSSSMVIDMMQRFLETGFSVDAALEMVNGALLTGGSTQNTSTLDCCMVDLYQGTCKFCKVGAAPSYLKRENLVEQISARNLPLGLLETPETEYQCRQLQDGDYIILLSDGILDAMNQGMGEASFVEIVSRFQTKNPGELANDILRFVLHQCRGQIRDDMTVLVAGFWKRR